jgi:hypothetical protein
LPSLAGPADVDFARGTSADRTLGWLCGRLVAGGTAFGRTFVPRLDIVSNRDRRTEKCERQ